ncbi:hypothetical protein K488DRAFT_83842 [Vararia minispora EC-137]|uniref:Uncharacterized protein n=1 Tax=Vararia minispora EC-137 TaxID=1314806 RepID=A0ACB8QSY8_9AGAM|nr:hypothetical protein K488DRAFT_83842 [Vararia minispora EC-137]
MTLPQPSAETTVFLGPKDKIYIFHLDRAGKEDDANVENWKGNTDGILVFVRFRLPRMSVDRPIRRLVLVATVTAFIIESYKWLSPDTDAQSVALLYHVASGQSGNLSSLSQSSIRTQISLPLPPTSSLIASSSSVSSSPSMPPSSRLSSSVHVVIR